MKKKIITIMVCLIFVGGCGTAGSLGIGAAGGFAASETLKGVEADLQKAKEAKLAELEQSLEKLANATDEVEKAALIAKIKALEKTVQDFQDAQQAALLLTEGTKVNWSDPEAVGGYGGMVLASLLAWYFRRKGKASETKYAAHKQGVELYSREHNESSAELYKNIGAARTNLGV